MGRTLHLVALILIVAAAPAARAVAPAEDPEKADYSLQIWVGKDGTTTKRYRARYSGRRTLDRLKALLGGRS